MGTAVLTQIPTFSVTPAPQSPEANLSSSVGAPPADQHLCRCQLHVCLVRALPIISCYFFQHVATRIPPLTSLTLAAAALLPFASPWSHWPQASQRQGHLRALALTVTSVLNVLPLDIHMADSCICFYSFLRCQLLNQVLSSPV